MKKATIAALLSLLVFPGTGHIYLKRIKFGMAIMAASLAALAVLIAEIFKVVWLLLDDISHGRAASDTVNLTELVRQQLESGNSDLLNIALNILLILWLGSVADAVRIGMKKET